MAKLIGERVPYDFFDTMIYAADNDCDGVVNFNEFYSLLATKKVVKEEERDYYLH